MVLDGSLFNAKHYKVWKKGRWRNPGKKVVSSSLPLDVVTIEKGVFGSYLTMVSQLTKLYIYI